MNVTTLLVIALALVAAILAGVELVRSRAQDLLAWSVLLAAIAIVADRL